MLNIDKIKSDSIPLGSYVHDDFNEKDPARYKPTDGSSINRADVNPWLLAKLLKSVTSLTPGTDRVDIVDHELEDGQKVKFGFTGGGITALTEYYVRNKTTDDFQLSTTPSGGILDLTSDQTGEMLTNVAWGFGNGSTTLNTPDLNGKFLRASGVSTTSQKANGSYYDGGAVGESFEDQMIGHWHNFNDAGTIAVAGAGTNSYDRFTPANNNQLVAGKPVRDPSTDGTNGTPNTGDENYPFHTVIKLKVRIA